MGVQVRYDITAEAAQQTLRAGASVTVEQPGLFQLKLNIGSMLQQSPKVPFPLRGSVAEIEVAREESWVEIIAPVADMPFLAARPDNVFPLGMHGYESCYSSFREMYTDFCNSQAPVLEHLAYVVPDALPILRVDATS